MPRTPDGFRQPRVLILMDGSSSMLAQWNNKMPRFKAAAKLVEELMDSVYRVNKQVEFGLRLYGHQYPAQENNCTDTRREVMFSKDNFTQMGLRMASLKPAGVSPMAYALKEAATVDMIDERNNAYSIILITDGGESCGGNVCEIIKELIYRKIFFKSFLINLNGNVNDYSGYTCLGDNIIVTNEKDVTDAVKRIMDSYTPFLKAPIKVEDVPPVTITQPEPQKPVDATTVFIPRSLHEGTGVRILPVVIKNNMAQTFRYKPVLKTLRGKPFPVSPIEKEKEPQTAVASLTSVSKSPVPVATQPAATLRTSGPAIATAPIEKEPVPIVPPPVATVPVKTTPPPPVKDTARTKVVIKPLPPVASTTPLPVKTTDNKPKEITYTASSEDAQETSLLVYFTDGHGKFYKTTPKLQLVNAKGETVKQFYRTVDANGNPDPQVLPAGSYSLVVPGKAKNALKNIVIHPNKKNKVVAVVNNGSLIFRYAGAKDRPVSEFEALVNILFEPGPTVKQRCTAELEYAPGNYHVEVNTLPITKYNVDIDFGNTSELLVRQPGFVQFTNPNPVGRANLYYQLGDRFIQFHALMLNGTPDMQKLRLQPGPYEVHWIKNAGQPNATEVVQKFHINSNAITEIELH